MHFSPKNGHLHAIAVVDQHWAIGRDGDLLFSLPGDMRHFRTLTTGSTVLMGRKTLDSFPGGNPLPKRRNVVLSHQQTLPQAVEVVHHVQDLLGALTPADIGFVIGGGTVYDALLPHCHTAYITKVDATAQSADTFFPNLDALPHWTLVAQQASQEENGLTYHFLEYRNTLLLPD